jgi:hypothetical protein
MSECPDVRIAIAVFLERIKIFQRKGNMSVLFWLLPIGGIGTRKSDAIHDDSITI